ncbi:MAG TPA: contractile injection system tape measure protein [Verrucomicrobiota bacterium]|nr:contractile injection system tape measure protein [Verrucomicrobiota bacterium]
MTASRHVVLCQIVEVTVPAKHDAQRVHDSVSRSCRGRLAKILEQHCDRLSDANTLHRIDRLEVNLGRVRLEKLEGAFDAALEGQLTAAVRERERDGGGQRENRIAAQFELINHFVRTGTLPWWVDPSNARPWVDSLRFLAREAEPELRRWILQLIQDSRALRRLILACTDSELVEWIGILSARPAGFSCELARGLLLVSQGLGANTPETPSRVSVWRGILTTLADRSTPPSETVDRLRGVLVRVSGLFGLPFAGLVSQLRSQLETLDVGGSPELRRALQTLEQPLSSARRAGADSGPWASLIDAVHPFLEESTGNLHADWNRWIEHATANPESGTPRNLTELGSWLRPALTAGLIPREVLVEWLARAGESGSKVPPAAVATVAALLGEVAELVKPLSQADRDLARLPNAFSNSGGMHVYNAGLVLLWPFLTPLFERLGLLEERHFRNNAAQQRAVGLLQHVAAGNPEPPPEHLLPLNKILCGLPTDELFEFGDAVTEFEADECTAVLQAVIEQAPMLGKISLPGFRGTFLLRQGQLSVRDESALLRVERQTFDIVLERLPWPLNWVRLPWMNVALQVVWL